MLVAAGAGLVLFICRPTRGEPDTPLIPVGEALS
jgi:hypothetical protein